MDDNPLPGMMVMAKFEQKNDTIVFSEGTAVLRWLDALAEAVPAPVKKAKPRARK